MNFLARQISLRQLSVNKVFTNQRVGVAWTQSNVSENFLLSNRRSASTVVSSSIFQWNSNSNPIALNLNSINCTIYTPVCFKSKTTSYNKYSAKSGQTDDDNDDDDAAELERFNDTGKKDKNLVQIKVQSMRLDAVIKAALGISRNKIEKLFYESKLRMNGKKITKKAITVKVDSEIDVIKNISVDNPQFLVVSRIELLSAKVDSEKELIVLTLRRFKNMTIENYPDTDSYNASTSDE